jgi:hypothetical protein
MGENRTGYHLDTLVNIIVNGKQICGSFNKNKLRSVVLGMWYIKTQNKRNPIRLLIDQKGPMKRCELNSDFRDQAQYSRLKVESPIALGIQASALLLLKSHRVLNSVYAFELQESFLITCCE